MALIKKPSRKKSFILIRPFLSLIQLFSYKIEDKDQVSNQLVWIIAITFVLFLSWAYLVDIDKVVTATAKAYPYEKLQTIEHYEGGRVDTIHVKKGDLVEKNSLLVTLSPIQSSGDLIIQTDLMAELKIRQNRLLAEFQNEESFDLPSSAYNAYIDIFRQERAIFSERRRRRVNELEGKKASLQSAKAMLTAAEIGQKTSAIEMSTAKLLYERGLEAELSFVKAQKLYADSVSAREQANQEVIRANAEIELTIREQQTNILEDLSQIRSEITKVNESIRLAADKVDRSELRASIRGIVNNVLVSTVGGTVKPGEPVIEIVPEDSTIVVEALISPADIGFIEVGQQALIKITAYDYSIFGSLKGAVDIIPADTTIDEDTGEPFYEVTIKIMEEYFDSSGENLKIIPGMEAQVDIIVGKRSAMDYILSPLMRVTQESLREK